MTGLKWTVFGRVASQAVTWGLTIYVIRLLSPEDYGLMALAGIFSAMFAMIAEIGLGPALVQSKDLPPERIRQIFGIVILSNGVGCLFMAVVVAPLAASFFGEVRLELVVQIIALQFLPAAFVVVPSALLNRGMKFRGRAITDFISAVAGGSLTLVLAYHGYGVFALAWGSVCQTVIRAIGLNVACPFSGLPIFRFTGCGSMFNFGRNVAATQLVWLLYSQADYFIAGRILGKHDLGVYSVSMDLSSLPAARLSAILNQLVYPSLSQVKRDGRSVGPYVLKGMRGISLASFPVMWGMSSVAPELVQALLGEKWAEAALPLALLCLIMPLRVLSPVMHAALQAVGRADISFRITCITAVAMCAAFLLGTQFGLIGLSLAWVLTFPAAFLFNLLRSCDHFDLPAREILKALSRPALAGGLMYASVALSRHVLPWSLPLVNLVALVAVGVVSYVGLTFAFNNEGVREARDLLFRRAN